MRISIFLDPELVAEAMRFANVNSKSALVELALREFVTNRKRKDMRDLQGQIQFSPDYDHKALREGD